MNEISELAKSLGHYSVNSGRAVMSATAKCITAGRSASFQHHASNKAPSAIVCIITLNYHVSKTQDRTIIFAGSSAKFSH